MTGAERLLPLHRHYKILSLKKEVWRQRVGPGRKEMLFEADST
jgi:hypothetical protein